MKPVVALECFLKAALPRNVPLTSTRTHLVPLAHELLAEMLEQGSLQRHGRVEPVLDPQVR